MGDRPEGRPPHEETSPRIADLKIGHYMRLLLLPVAGFLESGDVEFFHFEQGLHDAIGFLRIGIAHEFTQSGGNDLPKETEFVLEPTALTFLAAPRGELGPVVVNFVLRVAGDNEGNRFGEFEVRAGVQSCEFLAVQRKDDGQHAAFGTWAGFSAARNLSDFGIGKDRAVKIGRFFGLRIEPQEWRDFWHENIPPFLDL